MKFWVVKELVDPLFLHTANGGTLTNLMDEPPRKLRSLLVFSSAYGCKESFKTILLEYLNRLTNKEVMKHIEFLRNTILFILVKYKRWKMIPTFAEVLKQFKGFETDEEEEIDRDDLLSSSMSLRMKPKKQRIVNMSGFSDANNRINFKELFSNDHRGLCEVVMEDSIITSQEPHRSSVKRCSLQAGL